MVEATAIEERARGGRLPLRRRLAVAAVHRLLAGWRVGTLAVELPDGSCWTFVGEDPGRRVALRVKDWAFFWRVLAESDVGLGESYMAGEWECEDLVELLRLLLQHRSIVLQRGRSLMAPLRSLRRALARVRPRHAVRDVRAHYDLGNDFFASFLDESMTYSAATFATPTTTLVEAQRDKLDGICRRMRLAPGLRVLDIGCGWGSFALHAARVYGSRVTAVTLSAAQHALARERVREAGLEALVGVELRDYRDVAGYFDRIVSIEMFEAIGWRAYRAFFGACEQLLAPDGRMFLQTSVYPDQGFDAYRRDVDWLRTHIFPGGLLGSLRKIVETLASDTRLQIEWMQDIALDYATTLRAWRERFVGNQPAIRRLGYDEPFIRKWHLYLAMCEAAFGTRYLGTLQIVLAR